MTRGWSGRGPATSLVGSRAGAWAALRAAAVAAVLVARSARRLCAATAMGIVAGALMAVDGEAIVHSRTGLLDNMLMLWVLVAFGCLLLDREQARRGLAAR